MGVVWDGLSLAWKAVFLTPSGKQMSKGGFTGPDAERRAAIFYDKHAIRYNKPTNILKPI